MRKPLTHPGKASVSWRFRVITFLGVAFFILGVMGKFHQGSIERACATALERDGGGTLVFMCVLTGVPR